MDATATEAPNGQSTTKERARFLLRNRYRGNPVAMALAFKLPTATLMSVLAGRADDAAKATLHRAAANTPDISPAWVAAGSGCWHTTPRPPLSPAAGRDGDAGEAPTESEAVEAILDHMADLEARLARRMDAVDLRVPSRAACEDIVRNSIGDVASGLIRRDELKLVCDRLEDARAVASDARTVATEARDRLTRLDVKAVVDRAMVEHRARMASIEQAITDLEVRVDGINGRVSALRVESSEWGMVARSGADEVGGLRNTVYLLKGEVASLSGQVSALKDLASAAAILSFQAPQPRREDEIPGDELMTLKDWLATPGCPAGPFEDGKRRMATGMILSRLYAVMYEGLLAGSYYVRDLRLMGRYLAGLEEGESAGLAGFSKLWRAGGAAQAASSE